MARWWSVRYRPSLASPAMFLSAARTSLAVMGREWGALAAPAAETQKPRVARPGGHPLRAPGAGEGWAIAARLEHRQLARLAAHGPLHGADDVATLAQGAQRLFGIGVDGPGARLHLVGQAQALQAVQAADQQQALGVDRKSGV